MIYLKIAFTLSVLGMIGGAILHAASELCSEALALLGVAVSGAALLGLIGTLTAWVWSW